MLILARKAGESICIGDGITVTVLSIKGGNQVRLGIDAPQAISVDRQEIRERKEAGK